jgi:serine O-acetyltransferase
MTLRQTLRLIRSDLDASIRHRGGSPRWQSRLAGLLAPAGCGLAIWRVQAYLHRRRVPIVNRILGVVNLVLFALEMEPEIDADEGLVLLSPAGIMLHGHTRIGRECVFAHQITTALGPRLGFDPIHDFIVIGDRVVISAGVRIVGNLTIGADSWVGPNTVVAESIPPGSLVCGRSVRPRAPAIPDYESAPNLAASRR